MHEARLAPAFRRSAVVTLAVMLALAVAGCSQPTSGGPDGPAPIEATEVILASTTSTQDSGLFDELLPAFEQDNPQYKVKIIAVGTGEAIKLGETKDADVLLVHAKADEEAFVAAGYGVERLDVMYNDFVIVGPVSDPAKIRDAASTNAAMVAIRDAGESGDTVFVSRGDDSGTHKKELKLWTAASIDAPEAGAQEWYDSTGQGMGETLKIASEKQGYTLADRATYLSMKDALDLEVIYEKDDALLNQYGVIVVTDTQNQAGGQAFADWVVSAKGQSVIGQYGIEQFGEPLFVPNATP